MGKKKREHLSILDGVTLRHVRDARFGFINGAGHNARSAIKRGFCISGIVRQSHSGIITSDTFYKYYFTKLENLKFLKIEILKITSHLSPKKKENSAFVIHFT